LGTRLDTVVCAIHSQEWLCYGLSPPRRAPDTSPNRLSAVGMTRMKKLIGAGLGGVGAGSLQTFRLDYLSGRKIQVKFAGQLHLRKNGGGEGTSCPAAPLSRAFLGFGGAWHKKINLKAYKFAVQKKSLGTKSQFWEHDLKVDPLRSVRKIMIAIGLAAE
jgi:hypothetical protein